MLNQTAMWTNFIILCYVHVNYVGTCILTKKKKYKSKRPSNLFHNNKLFNQKPLKISYVWFIVTNVLNARSPWWGIRISRPNSKREHYSSGNATYSYLNARCLEHSLSLCESTEEPDKMWSAFCHGQFPV